MKHSGKRTIWDCFFISQLLVNDNYIPFHDLEPQGLSYPTISISPETLLMIKDEFDHMSFLSKQILEIVISPTEIDKKSKQPKEFKRWTPTEIRRHFTRQGYPRREVKKAMGEIRKIIPLIF